MMGTVVLFGIKPNIVRGRIDVAIREESGTWHCELVIHPANAELIDVLFENILFHPDDGVQRLSFREMPSGGILEWSNTRGEPPLRFSLPNATMWTANEIRF